MNELFSAQEAGMGTVLGGVLNDTVQGAEGPDYLRGDGGDDSISGGAGFDDINGNMGNDIAAGGHGDDWVVGGKDNDSLRGEDGADIVYGNLGDDICEGGDGADTMRGGQANDVLTGGAGDDWLSGDRGDDTVTGGEGADIFHFFPGAGQDRVTDFSYDSGDLLYFDPPGFSLRQFGADVVITLETGDTLTLVGVANLPDDFFFTPFGRYRSTTPGDDVIRAGPQADIIPSSSGGIDRVFDFAYASGDRLLIGYDETYSLAQVGPDLVATMGFGGQMILMGVTLAELPGDWLQRKGAWDY